MPVDAFIQQELDAPITKAERASKINRWGSPKPKPEPTEAEKIRTLAEGRASRLRAKEAKAAKLAQGVDYYAKTDVPFDRVKEHTGLKLEDVIREMRARGRPS